MFTKSFKGGIHPSYKKEFTRSRPIETLPPPKKAVISLSQHIGAMCEPIVKVGESVKAGQLVGISDKFISSPVHAPISGKVTIIDDMPHPVLVSSPAIVIESDGGVPPVRDLERVDADTEKMPPEEIRKAVSANGIVGMGGAAFPSHVKLTPPDGKDIEYVIVNGAECEPYLTCDHRMMIEEPDGILRGLFLAMDALSVSRAIIAIESNKSDAISFMRRAVVEANRTDKDIIIRELDVKYPQGAEKQLIWTLLGKEVPSGKLPLDVGVVVHNVQTLFAIYEAIYKHRPLIDRVVTVTGSRIRRPSNLRVMIGTPISDLLDFCGLEGEPVKVISGGPMMGIALSDMDAPVIKGTSGILVLAQDEINRSPERACIRCSRCVDVCPMNLLPTEIMRLARAARWGELTGFNITDCIECGCCEYACPSKIQLVHLLKLGKLKRLQMERAGK